MISDFVSNIFHRAPEVAIFLSLGLGYLFGRVRIGSFTLGATAGTLLVGVLLGIMTPGLEISPLIKTVFFALFIYAVGFKTGPQFFHGFDLRMINQIILTVVVTVSGLVCVLLGAKALKLDAGMAAGLAAGGLTQSAIIGTAGDAISRLGLAADEVKRLQNNVAIGYAVTYVFGTVGVIFIARDIAPRLLGIDLKKASAESEARLAGGKRVLKPGQFNLNIVRDLRVFEVGKNAGGKTVEQVEKSLGGRCFIEIVRRGDTDLNPTPSQILEHGDIALVAGERKGLLDAMTVIGPEIQGTEFNALGESLDAVVTRKEVIGKKLREFGMDAARGVFLRRIIRGGTEMPISLDFELQRGDTLTLVGMGNDVKRVGAMIGSIERPSDKTDLLYCGVGIVFGTLIGLLSIKIAGVPVTLGAGGGVLVAGLIFGWLRSLHPTFGNFPGPVQTVFSDLGLNGFIAVVGLSAGPSAWNALKETGIGLFVAGIFATVVPPFIGLFLGKLMKMDPVVLVGAICGARSANPAIGAVTDYAESSAPAVGFTVPYAIANVLLTVWGPVIVGIMS